MAGTGVFSVHGNRVAEVRCSTIGCTAMDLWAVLRGTVDLYGGGSIGTGV